LTEFGDNSSKCTGAWDTSVIAYADQTNISWTAWGWYVPGSPPTALQLCQFPSLISDWSGTPSVQGQVVKQALLSYPAAQCASSVDAGSDSAAKDGGSVDGTTALDSGTDAPSPDSGVVDSAAGDTGAPDAGIADSGTLDVSSVGISDATDAASMADAVVGDVALEAATAIDGMTTGDASADASLE
jgi:hypothetical protein